MNLVLINGHVACLKTTLGYLLAPILQLGHVTTSVLGEFVSDATAPNFNALREARYRTTTAITREFLREGVSVILDGTFSRRAWREAIYHLADQFGVEDVVAITCVCSNPAIVQQRLAYRRIALDAPDAAANHWSAYAGSVKDFEPIGIDRLPGGRRISRLVFDSASFDLRREVIMTPFAETVAVAMERLMASGRLSRPLFGFGQVAGPPHALPAKRLIALEGLGGSGKSTQVRALSDLFVRQGRRVICFTEFSDGPVGSYLRSRSSIAGGDHRVRVTEGMPSHTESLLVLGDSIARVHALCESRLQGEPPYDVIVADSYIWSHLAHGLAHLPDESESELQQNVSAVLAEIVAPLSAIADRQDTVFFRISAELAAERIEQRSGKRLSKESRRFIARLFDIYEDLAKASSATIVDGLLPPAEITRIILAELEL